MSAGGPALPSVPPKRPDPRKVAIIAILVMATLLVAGVIIWAVLAFRPAGAPSPSPSPSAGTASPVSVRTPSPGELSDLGQAFNSGETSTITPYLGLGPSEEVDPAFVAGLADLGLSVNATSLRQVGGTFEVDAVDKANNAWVIGLTYVDGQLTVIYAEPK